MARIEESVEIKRPVEHVFDYTTQAGSWPKWQSIIPKAEQTSQESVGVGTIFKGVVRLMGLSMDWSAKATEYEPNRKFSKDITSGPMTIEQHNTYDPIEAGTKFTIMYNLNVGGLLKPFSPIIVSSMRKELNKSLSKLKSVLETQTYARLYLD